MPNYDLVAVWEEHLRSEFVARDVNAPTDTMVPDACVNHVPTMTGGVCRDELKRFYKYHFVKANPPDIEIIPISRTVGQIRLSMRWSPSSPIHASSTICCQESHPRAGQSRSQLS